MFCLRVICSWAPLAGSHFAQALFPLEVNHSGAGRVSIHTMLEQMLFAWCFTQTKRLAHGRTAANDKRDSIFASLQRHKCGQARYITTHTRELCGFLDVEALDSCTKVHRIMTHLLPLVNSFPWAGGTISSDLYSVSLQLYTLRRHSHK